MSSVQRQVEKKKSQRKMNNKIILEKYIIQKKMGKKENKI